MKLYYRFQPPGLPLRGHTSIGSGESLRPGRVYAYDTPEEAMSGEGPFGGWAEDVNSLEVVTFEGKDEYNPGDYEGVAVKPEKIVRRETPRDWLNRMKRHHDENVRAHALATLERLPHGGKSRYSVSSATRALQDAMRR